MNDVAVVVLHYETINDTEKCVDSLLMQNTNEFNIIIVDNGSKKGKVDGLKEKYKEELRIFFVDSQENLGFAKGNNLGFSYAKFKLNSKLIVLANNDLIFDDTGFIKSLKLTYEKEKFDVAGPQIISLMDGTNQNPVRRLFKNINEVNRRLIKLHILYITSFIGIDQMIKKYISKPVEKYYYRTGDDFQLHGACMIFGNQFVQEHDGIYPGTFMYGEEDILKYQIEMEKLKLVYLDDITVKHKEGASTSSIFGKSTQKRRFFYRWSIDSIQHLKRIMKNNV